ncbi:MAG: sigma-70 family RNA polymerase sigma factor [Planctomycetota bacterium]|nr:sigma-70 family RNA polymerase sigma factor [Planctomycetota bacterium]
MTDAELIHAIRAGDETALEALYHRYLPSVWRYACSQLAGNVHAAEDVTSETFLAAVRQVGALRPEGGSVAAWLVGIARHKIGDLQRRRRRERLADTDPAETGLPCPGAPDGAAAMETAETRASVKQVMDALADDERLALEWKYLDGLSVREIALRLGRTQKAAEAVLYRARNAFRTAFERARPTA